MMNRDTSHALNQVEMHQIKSIGFFNGSTPLKFSKKVHFLLENRALVGKRKVLQFNPKVISLLILSYVAKCNYR